MRAKVIEVRWHVDADGLPAPVHAVDFHESGVLATGGADGGIHLWVIKSDSDPSEKKEACVTFVYALKGHQKSVNSIRFSPNGECLASAGDGGAVVVWTKGLTAGPGWAWNTIESDRDISRTSLRGHVEDVYDICWCPESKCLIAGAIDNQAIVWNVATKERLRTLDGHSHYVQGVAWDPLNQFICTQSSDRTCRVYSTNMQSDQSKKEKKKNNQTISHLAFDKAAQAAELDAAPDDVIQTSHQRKQYKMYYDENANTYFRRLTFSPDGALLFTPTAFHKKTASSPAVPTVYAFVAGQWSAPAFHLPLIETAKASVGVRCSPILYKVKDTKEPSLVNLPYRIVFAVTTMDTVLIYDTQHLKPLAIIENLHCAALTDTAWSADGVRLMLASNDGYCSIVVFEEGELGERLSDADIPAAMKRKHQPTYSAKTSSKKQLPAAAASVTSAASGSSTVLQKIAALATEDTKSQQQQQQQKKGDGKATKKRIAPTLMNLTASADSAVPGPAKVKKRARITPTLVS